MKTPTPEQLRKLFDYDATTGTLTRKGATIVAGAPTANGYGSVWIDGTSYLTHRIIWALVHGAWPIGDLDHKDGDPGNNRLHNLRTATRTQNLANRRRNAGKNYPKGVAPHGAGFRARIRHQGRLYNLGTYSTVDEAAAAYMAKASILFGEYARAA